MRIGIIGDYDPVGKPHHPRTNEAICHAAESLGVSVEVQWVPTPDLVTADEENLRRFDALWASAGSPYASLEGGLNAIRFAREHDYPFLGT